MKTKILGIALAVALLLAPMALIAPARAQEDEEEPRNVYASEVEIEIDGESDPVKVKLPQLINMETGGEFKYKNRKYIIKPNNGAVYNAEGHAVGRVTQTKYYTEPEAKELVVEIVGFSHKVSGGSKKWYYDCTQATINNVTVDLPSPVLCGKDSGSFIITDGNTTITYYYDTDGNVYSDAAHTTKVGNLVLSTTYAVHPGDKFDVQVTLKATGEPVGGATVTWDGATESGTTDAFGTVRLTVEDMTVFDTYGYGDWGAVKAVKEYGGNATLVRSAYGISNCSIAVIPYDLSNPKEFLAWWSHYALTEEAQAMYEAAEVLGEWGANLSEDVTVWSNIFGGPKGGKLAEFIRGFPNFMVDRGAAMEATQNMLDTIWALFSLLPACALASPELLRTMPMRMLQFWPALFTNLDKVLFGISDMVIDLGVFMMSLAPSVLLLLPDIVKRLPNVGPEAMNIVLTAFEFFVQMIPALSQYLPAAIAAIPAFFIQMLIALFFNAPAIFSTAADETIATIKNLFKSWPLFPAGIAAGILAAAPALMMMPSLAPLVVFGRTIENTAGALGEWMQELRKMPSTMLDPILHALGTNCATLAPRYGIVGIYCLGTSVLFAPAIFIALGALVLSLIPLGILALSLVLAPVFALCMFMPWGWAFDIVWAAWMTLSVIASWAVTVPGTLADVLEYLFMRATQVCTMPGYAVGWCLQGVLDILEIGFVEDLTGMLKDIVEKFPEIINTIMPIIEEIIKVIPILIQGTGTATAAAAGGGSSLLSLLGTIGPFLAGALAGGAGGTALGAAGGAAVGATGGAVATGAAAAVTPL